MKQSNKTYSEILVIGAVGRGMSFKSKQMTLSKHLRSSEKDLVIIDPKNENELSRVHNIPFSM